MLWNAQSPSSEGSKMGSNSPNGARGDNCERAPRADMLSLVSTALTTIAAASGIWSATAPTLATGGLSSSFVNGFFWLHLGCVKG